MAADEFKDHLATIAERWEAALSFAGFDAAIVTAGEPRLYFLDDQAPPVRLNPHFLQWCPETTAAGSALLIRPGQPPRLYFLQPEDYWHMPPEVPVWAREMEVKVFGERDPLFAEVRRDALTTGNHVALVGETAGAPDDFPPQDVNPTLLIDHLHFDRAVKTPFELTAMREATRKGVRGHLAAAAAFAEGESEFRINLRYLAASEQLPAELPYANIVALNEHAGVLHYQHYDRQPPPARQSFLIDAGGSHLGYAADITRTYAADGRSAYGELVARLDDAQRAIIDSVTPGVPYLELHVDMHRRLAGILVECGLARGSAEAVFSSGLTETFLPHGLGHLIGLQTHDVGGQQTSHEGGTAPPPDNYPTLRTTRALDKGMPVTIEPGLYFIPQLLNAAKGGPGADLIDWDRVDALRPCGGIRIEDNVVIRDDGRVENLTRDAFAELGS